MTNGQQTKVASLQVKFSKDYLGAAGSALSPGVVSTGWWTFQRKKIAASSADYWVLVLYRFQSRQFDFVVIPPRELLARYDRIAPGRLRSKATSPSRPRSAAGRREVSTRRRRPQSRPVPTRVQIGSSPVPKRMAVQAGKGKASRLTRVAPDGRRCDHDAAAGERYPLARQKAQHGLRQV